MIDVNVYLDQWPFRRLPDDEPRQLMAKLIDNGVEEAWAGSFDGLLQRDIGSVNRRVAEQARRLSVETSERLRIRPVATINPTVPGWLSDLRQCHDELGMKIIRLHPNYHGYTLGDPRFDELLDRAAEMGLILQIAVAMEDVRTQSPLLQVPDVDVTPLLERLRGRNTARVVLLNALRSVRLTAAGELAAAGRIWFDIGMLEGVNGVSNLLESVPVERVLFGSYAPFFYHESAVLKLQESPLGQRLRSAIAQHNARQLLGSPTGRSDNN